MIIYSDSQNISSCACNGEFKSCYLRRKACRNKLFKGQKGDIGEKGPRGKRGKPGIQGPPGRPAQQGDIGVPGYPVSLAVELLRMTNVH
jgi:Collagen triple helix repeat (20 copies)